MCKHTCKLPASQYWRTIQVSAILAPVAESVLPRSWDMRVTDPVRRVLVAMSDDTFAPLSPEEGRGSGEVRLLEQLQHSKQENLGAKEPHRLAGFPLPGMVWRGEGNQKLASQPGRAACQRSLLPTMLQIATKQLSPVNRVERPVPNALKLVICSSQ